MTYRIAWRVLANDPVAFFFFALALWLCSLLGGFFGIFQLALPVMWVTAAYYTHRAVLFGEKRILSKTRIQRRNNVVRFTILCTVAFVLLASVLGAVILTRYLPALSEQNPETLLEVVAVALGMIVLMTLIFGTAWPAAAAADKFGVVLTVKRSFATWPRLLWYLLSGPILVWMVFWYGIFFSAESFDVGLFPSDESLSQAGSASLSLGWRVALSFGWTLGSLFQLILTTTALCRAYAFVAPEDIRLMLYEDLRSASARSHDTTFSAS